MYLDRDISRRLLENLSDTEVKEIGMAMSTIEKISPQEIEVAVTEFMKELVDTAMVNRFWTRFVKKILPDLSF